MKRFAKAAAFFLALLTAWELLVRAKVWSPVLMPSPLSVAAYLGGAITDGTLAAAILVTLRRLLLGLRRGDRARPAARPAHRPLPGAQGHAGAAGPGAAGAPERLLGAARAPLVRPD